MTQSWSHKLSDRFQLQLPRDLAQWIDDQWWRRGADGEFEHGINPDELLDGIPDQIWPGFMLPDTLPLIGNRYGDWLCARVASDNSIREIIYWYHGGGDWVPFGRSLSEAILYDAVRYPSADAVYHTSDGPESDSQLSGSQTLWAADQLGVEHETLELWNGWISQGLRGQVYEDLLQRRIAEVAIRRDLIERALSGPLRSSADQSLARRLEVPWEPNFVSWLFDTRLIPKSVGDDLREWIKSDQRPWDWQDWFSATEHATSVTESRMDLGWACDIAGWGAERSGDFEKAISYYWRGMNTSVFSDQSIRMRTHWFDERFAKFSVWRLYELKHNLGHNIPSDPYLELLWSEHPTPMRASVRDYWYEVASNHLRANRFPNAYDAFIRAGWDVGAQQLSDYEKILSGAAAAAESCGWLGRAAIANLHLACLRQR